MKVMDLTTMLLLLLIAATLIGARLLRTPQPDPERRP